MGGLKTYRFEIVADPGASVQVLETLCLDDAAAREAAELFAIDAASVTLWQEARMIWTSPPLIS
jgi:hypothetical protein